MIHATVLAVRNTKNVAIEKKPPPFLQSVDMKELRVHSDTDPELFGCSMSEDDYCIAADCYEAICSMSTPDKAEAFDQVDQLLKKYPAHPALLTAQIIKPLVENEVRASLNLARNFHKKFPDLALAMLIERYCEFEAYNTWSFTHLKQQDAACPDAITLDSIMEYESALSVTKVLLILSINIHAQIAQNNLQQATKLLDMTANLADRLRWDDHWLIHRMTQVLESSKTMRRFRILIAKRLQSMDDKNASIPSDR